MTSIGYFAFGYSGLETINFGGIEAEWTAAVGGRDIGLPERCEAKFAE